MTSPAVSRLTALILQRVKGTGISLSANQLEKIEAYYSLLQRWNARINLTALPLGPLESGEFPPETVDRLLIEPIVAAGLVVPDEPADWFDLGSGGGSPAVPMKVVRPRLQLNMVEVKQRKASFLREAIRTLELSEAQVLAERVEGIQARKVADLVTSRAVRLSDELARNIAGLLRPGGRLLVFASGDLDGEALSRAGLRFERRLALAPTGAFLHLWQGRLHSWQGRLHS